MYTNGRITAPSTDLARQWSGWGTALKPAYEPIILARKPLVGTVAANVARFGTGALNIDGCRVEVPGGWAAERGETWLRSGNQAQSRSAVFQGPQVVNGSCAERVSPLGRWPANVMHDGSEEVVGAFPTLGKSAGGSRGASRGLSSGMGAIDEPQGYGDSGSASRFFYCAKASRSEREHGLDDGGSARKNHHPTVKPLALMRYLVRLVTPPGGTVLDPCLGSGTTAVAAMEEGFAWCGIEREAAYITLAESRTRAVTPKLWALEQAASMEQP